MHLGKRPVVAEVIVRQQHVERYPPLVERNQKSSKTAVQRIDVIKELKTVGLAPGQDLTSEAHEQITDIAFQVGLEETLPIGPYLPQALARAGDRDVDLIEGDRRHHVPD